jgi:hypothetical protein
MKKTIIVTLLLAIGLMGLNGCNKEEKNPPPALVNGTYTGSGTISFTDNGTTYTLPFLSLSIRNSNTITISAQDEVTSKNIVLTLTASPLNVGTYKINSANMGNSITYNAFSGASYSIAGSGGTMNLSKLTTSEIQGTFSAEIRPMSSWFGGTTASFTNGVINISYQ